MKTKRNINNLFLIALHPLSTFSLIGESQGICAISGYLQSKYKELSIHLYDQQIDLLDSIVNEILIYKPAVIGFSVKIYTFPQFKKIYKLISEIVFPIYKPIILIGNSVPHFSGKEILEKYHNDVIISLGEGEVSFGDLYEHLLSKRDFKDIRNIMYMDKGNIMQTKFEYLDKSEIPFSDRRNSLKYFNLGGEIYIEGSRGCAYCACSICECRYFLGSSNIMHKWRDRPICSIVDELEILASLGIKVVTFSDEDFLGSDNWGLIRAISLADEIINRNIKIDFRINARVKSFFNKNDNNEVNLCRKNVFEKLKYAGLVKVFLGFESGSQAQIYRYNKGFMLEEFLMAKSILVDLKIEFELGFICLDPLMSIEELSDSLKFIKENQCIPYISTIYKELRIQKGNHAYLEKIRRYEYSHAIKIVGDLDFDKQKYDILQYADTKITVLSSLMNEYDKETYKLYYLMRIFTQYSCNEDDSALYQLIYQTIEKVKNNDYDLIMELVYMLQKDKQLNTLKEVLVKYSNKRESIYLYLMNSINENNIYKYSRLKELITTTYSIQNE